MTGPHENQFPGEKVFEVDQLRIVGDERIGGLLEWEANGQSKRRFGAGPAMSRDEQISYGTRLFEALVDMASGRPSKSEELGFGTEEIVPWRMGAVM